MLDVGGVIDPNAQFLKELFRFLYADPTPGALEVFLQDPGHLVQTAPDLPPTENVETGVWIKADPIPGCVVCNIGESKLDQFALLTLSYSLQCGRYGPMVSTRARSIE